MKVKAEEKYGRGGYVYVGVSRPPHAPGPWDSLLQALIVIPCFSLTSTERAVPSGETIDLSVDVSRSHLGSSANTAPRIPLASKGSLRALPRLLRSVSQDISF